MEHWIFIYFKKEKENLKMKTKIKNDFQNPDLIFKNENQKRKSKTKIDFYF